MKRSGVAPTGAEYFCLLSSPSGTQGGPGVCGHRSNRLFPVTALGELEAGFQLGEGVRENRVALMAFLAEPFVSVAPTSVEVALRYGEICSQLRRAGTPIPTNDIWIAATTIDCGGQLLTFDQHFANVPGLRHTLIQI